MIFYRIDVLKLKQAAPIATLTTVEPNTPVYVPDGRKQPWLLET